MEAAWVSRRNTGNLTCGVPAAELFSRFSQHPMLTANCEEERACRQKKRDEQQREEKRREEKSTKPWRSAAVPACCSCSCRHWSAAQARPTADVPAACLTSAACQSLRTSPPRHRSIIPVCSRKSLSPALQPRQHLASCFRDARSTGSATIRGGQTQEDEHPETSLHLAPKFALLLPLRICFFVCTYQIHYSRHIFVEIRG